MSSQNNNLEDKDRKLFLNNYLEVRGGNSLNGHIQISGAKNSVLVLMAAAILSKEKINLFNVPQILDVEKMFNLLVSMGINITASSGKLEIITNKINQPIQNEAFKLCQELRASFFCIGPILARYGVAKIPLPGGCSIGARPIEEHIQSLKRLGVNFKFKNNYLIAEAINNEKRLIGSTIKFQSKSVGATETLMMVASLAKGTTTINNAAKEPEITDLAKMLNLMGANVSGAGSEQIVIEGVEFLRGCDFHVMPDRIEAGTFLIAAAITRSSLSLSPVFPEHLNAVIKKLEECGCRFEYSFPKLKIIPNQILNSVNITTSPFPGFPTDLQAPFMALMTTLNGISTIEETVFENRMQHVKELNRMGSKIILKDNFATITGVKNLKGTAVSGSDLRATAAIALAALYANGESAIYGLNHLKRGYENFASKLNSIGADISNVS